MKLDYSEVKTVTEIGAMIKLRYRYMVEANQDWGKAVGKRHAYTDRHGYTAIRKDPELLDAYETMGYDISQVNQRITRLAGEINTLWKVLGVKR